MVVSLLFLLAILPFREVFGLNCYQCPNDTSLHAACTDPRQIECNVPMPRVCVRVLEGNGPGGSYFCHDDSDICDKYKGRSCHSCRQDNCNVLAFTPTTPTAGTRATSVNAKKVRKKGLLCYQCYNKKTVSDAEYQFGQDIFGDKPHCSRPNVIQCSPKQTCFSGDKGKQVRYHDCASDKYRDSICKSEKLKCEPCNTKLCNKPPSASEEPEEEILVTDAAVDVKIRACFVYAVLFVHVVVAFVY